MQGREVLREAVRRRLAIGYLRVSTKGQARAGDRDRQCDALLKGCEAQGIRPVTIYEDELTGFGSMVLERNDGLLDALRVASEQSLPIVVTEVARVARDVETIRRVCEDRGVELIRVDGGDPAQYLGHAQRGQVFATRVRQRTRDELSRRGIAGKRLGGQRGLGKAQRKGAIANALRHEMVVQQIAEFLRREDPLSRSTIKEIAARMNELRMKSGRNRPWTTRAAEVPVRKARHQLRLEEELEQEEEDEL